MDEDGSGRTRMRLPTAGLPSDCLAPVAAVCGVLPWWLCLRVRIPVSPSTASGASTASADLARLILALNDAE